MKLYKGGADIFELSEDGKQETEIPKLTENNVEDSYKMILALLSEIHNTDAQQTAPKLNKDVNEYIDLLSDHFDKILGLNGYSFNRSGFNGFLIEMCNKLYNFMLNEKVITGGTRRRAQSPVREEEQHSLVNSNSKTPYRRRFNTKALINSWIVQCIILISLLGSIFMAYIAYSKFNHMLDVNTQTGSVFEISDFINEIGTGIGDGFTVYVWKTITNDYNLIDTYYTSMYKDLIQKYLEASASNIAEKAKSICVGQDVFNPGTLSIGTADVTETVNKIVKLVTGLVTFKDTTNCVSNTLKLLTLQEFERIKTLISLKFEEISMNHTQIQLYLQYASFLAGPALLYYPVFFLKFGKKIIQKIKQSISQIEREPHMEQHEPNVLHTITNEDNNDNPDPDNHDADNHDGGSKLRVRGKSLKYSIKNKKFSRRKTRRSVRRNHKYSRKN